MASAPSQFCALLARASGPTNPALAETGVTLGDAGLIDCDDQLPTVQYLQCDPMCIPDCENRTCGTDSCYGDCGTCDVGETCNASGTCDPL